MGKAADGKNLRIFGLAGSMRRESVNRKLLAHAAQAAEAAGASVDLADLRELDIPFYDGDLEAEGGLPESVQKLKNRIAQADGLLLACPEYNHSIPGAFKNALDWASRGEPKVFPGKAAAVMGASPGGFGAVRSQTHLRQVLAALGVWVVPGAVMLPRAGGAFDEAGALTDETAAGQVESQVAQLLAQAARLKNG